MMRRLIPFATAMAVTLSFAAGTSVRDGEATYFVDTGTKGGKCLRIISLRHGATKVTCKDGSSSAALDTRLGCLDSKGAGYCGKDVPPRLGLSGSQLNCLRASYYLFSGVTLDNNCQLRKGTKSCHTSDGRGYAEANCKTGCDRSGAGGICCLIGTPGCPPVNPAGTVTP